MSSTMDIEKNAISQNYHSVPNSESASIRSQPCPSSTKEQDIGEKNGKNTVVNGDHASKTGGKESENDNDNKWHNFAFIACWCLGACILVIPLALSGTVFRTAHIKDVRLFGFFFWLAISWCSLFVSYIISWTLGYCWFHLCQNELRWFFSDDYETFMVDIRHSMMIFLWAITSWALVPLLCILDHHNCTDHWVAVLHKVLLVTFLSALLFLVKSFLLERLFIKTAMKTMTKRQKKLEISFYAIVVLLPIFDQGPSIKSTYEWVKAMRTWSAPKSTIEYNLEQDNSDSPPTTPIPAPIPTPLPTPLPTHLPPPPPPPPPSPPTHLPTLLPPPQPPKIPTNTEVAQYVADIFQGKGKGYNDVYKTLRSAIEGNHRLREGALHGDGLYKEQVKEYLKLLHKEEKCRLWYMRNKDFSLALSHFKNTDDLWQILQDSRVDNEHDTEFVSFDSLAWLILYLGECLKEAVDGQKNLKLVVNSLDLRLTLFLCIPVAIIYVAIFTKNFATNFDPLWTAFFGISFAIQDPVKEFVSACVFVFAQHPYDKGDLIILPTEEKELKLVVTQIYLMHTSFEPVEKGKDIHIPHSKLSSDCIENWSRLAQADLSPHSVVLHLDSKSKLPDLRDMWQLQADVTKYVRDHPSRFYKSPELTRVPINEGDLMESGLNVEFKTKRKIPRRFYHHNKNFRSQVLRYLRSRLQEKGFSSELAKEAGSQPDQDTKQGIAGYGSGS